MRPAAFSSSPKLPELYEEDPYCNSFSAPPRSGEPGCRTIHIGSRNRLLGQRRQGFRSVDPPAYLLDGCTPSGRPLCGRSAPHPLWQQSNLSRRNVGRSRHRRCSAQPESGASARPDCERTERDRDRPVFRDEATSVELGSPEPLFHVRSDFAARLAQWALVCPTDKKCPDGIDGLGQRPHGKTTAQHGTTPSPATGLDALTRISPLLTNTF